MKFEIPELGDFFDIYHSRNLLMKFEEYTLEIIILIYHSRNLLMKFELLTQSTLSTYLPQ